jgi:hypothetical protein
MKLYTIEKYWIVEDGNRSIIFDTSTDAWRYIFLMREIRPKIHYVKELYPVKSLSPFPNFNRKTVKYKKEG